MSRAIFMRGGDRQIPVALFLKSYVRAHTRVVNGKVVKVGSYHNGVTPKGVEVAARDARTIDMFDQQESNKAHESDLEAELRAAWTASGVPKERQDELIRQIGEKAKAGAHVGPFAVGDKTEKAGSSKKS